MGVFSVAGTMLFIIAGPGAWLNRVLLSHPVLLWFGLVSCPLYLWHWPFLSFARIINGEAINTLTTTTLVFVSVVLAWLTFRFLKRPLRLANNKSVPFLIVLMLILGAAGYASYAKEGF